MRDKHVGKTPEIPEILQTRGLTQTSGDQFQYLESSYFDNCVYNSNNYCPQPQNENSTNDQFDMFGQRIMNYHSHIFDEDWSGRYGEDTIIGDSLQGDEYEGREYWTNHFYRGYKDELHPSFYSGDWVGQFGGIIGSEFYRPSQSWVVGHSDFDEIQEPRWNNMLGLDFNSEPHEDYIHKSTAALILDNYGNHGNLEFGSSSFHGDCISGPKTRSRSLPSFEGHLEREPQGSGCEKSSGCSPGDDGIRGKKRYFRFSKTQLDEMQKLCNLRSNPSKTQLKKLFSKIGITKPQWNRWVYQQKLKKRRWGHD